MPGVNLASIAETTEGTNAFSYPQLGNTDFSDDVTAVVDWFGPVNFFETDGQFEAFGITPVFGKTSSATSAESLYLGKLITEIPAVAAQANPESYISSGAPLTAMSPPSKPSTLLRSSSKRLAKTR